jgi:hypothetical protein
MERHEIDTWDYQWTYTIFKNDGITIYPAKNLITNIGFGSDATHTSPTISLFNNLKRFEITEIAHPDKIKINVYLMNKTMKVAFSLNWLWYLKKIIKILLLKLLHKEYSNL